MANNSTSILLPTLTGYNTNPAFIRVNKSGTIPPPAPCSPLATYIYQGNSTGMLSMVDFTGETLTIIDQATFLWGESFGESWFDPYSQFIASEYSANMLSGTGFISGVTLINAENYPIGTCLEYATVNTDNMMAIDGGIDITDPAAIKASTRKEVLDICVISTEMRPDIQAEIDAGTF